jgi:hypothetical protein
MAISDIINHLKGDQMARVLFLVLAKIHMVVVTNADNLNMKVTAKYKKITSLFRKNELIVEFAGGAVV